MSKDGINCLCQKTEFSTLVSFAFYDNLYLNCTCKKRLNYVIDISQ